MHPLQRPIKVRSIIFTEACPLDCRYCNFKQDDNYGTGTNFTKEQLFEYVDTFDKLDDENLIDTRVLFSGGEPLLRWEWIKEIILKYQDRFSYSFNTSGYLFTEEILEFLSHYRVDFTLSIDGDETLTNYLRPVVNNPYKVGYMKQFRKIVPTLLYYFPTTPFRLIVNGRYVDLLYRIYKFADELNFPYFTFLLDFNNRNFHRPQENFPENAFEWNESHTQILREQLDLILNDMLTGFAQNIRHTQIIGLNKILTYLFNERDFKLENMQCQLFQERSLTTLYEKSVDAHCLKADFPDINNLADAVLEQYDELNHKCLKDKDCPIFEYCCEICCIQNGFYKSKQFFDFDDLECVVNKCCYEMAIKLLSIGNDICKNSKLYQNYILEIMEGG